MEEYIHLENLALLRKRLIEPHDHAAHQVLLKLLMEEEAKAPKATAPKTNHGLRQGS